MKYFMFCILFLISCNLTAKGKPDYINVAGITGNYYELENLEDFLYFMRENKTKKIFYSDEFFIIRSSYASYTLKHCGYKTVEDYKRGNKKGFKDGEDYYFAILHKLKTQKDVEEYKTLNKD